MNDITVPEKPDFGPLQLIDKAITAGMAAEQLEKLMDLQQRWQADQAVKAYHAAMNRCQARMPVVVKDRDNKHTQSKYASLESIEKVAKPIYVSEGFSLSFGTAASPLEGHVRITCDVMHVDGHMKEKILDLPIDLAGAKGTANKSAVQGYGSTVSYGERYLLVAIFNITIANRDDDGNGSRGYITPDQVEQLNKLIELSGTDPKRFLTWAKIEHLGVMPQSVFPKAFQMLTAKMGKAEKGVA